MNDLEQLFFPAPKGYPLITAADILTAQSVVISITSQERVLVEIGGRKFYLSLDRAMREVGEALTEIRQAFQVQG